jgi:hypothetical protein
MVRGRASKNSKLVDTLARERKTLSQKMEELKRHVAEAKGCLTRVHGKKVVADALKRHGAGSLTEDCKPKAEKYIVVPEATKKHHSKALTTKYAQDPKDFKIYSLRQWVEAFGEVTRDSKGKKTEVRNPLRDELISTHKSAVEHKKRKHSKAAPSTRLSKSANSKKKNTTRKSVEKRSRTSKNTKRAASKKNIKRF